MDADRREGMSMDAKPLSSTQALTIAAVKVRRIEAATGLLCDQWMDVNENQLRRRIDRALDILSGKVDPADLQV